MNALSSAIATIETLYGKSLITEAEWNGALVKLGENLALLLAQMGGGEMAEGTLTQRLLDGLNGLVSNAEMWNTLSLAAKTSLLLSVKAALRSQGHTDARIDCMFGTNVNRAIGEAVKAVSDAYVAQALEARAAGEAEAAAAAYVKAMEVQSGGNRALLFEAVA